MEGYASDKNLYAGSNPETIQPREESTLTDHSRIEVPRLLELLVEDIASNHDVIVQRLDRLIAGMTRLFPNKQDDSTLHKARRVKQPAPHEESSVSGECVSTTGVELAFAPEKLVEEQGTAAADIRSWLRPELAAHHGALTTAIQSQLDVFAARGHVNGDLLATPSFHHDIPTKLCSPRRSSTSLSGVESFSQSMSRSCSSVSKLSNVAEDLADKTRLSDIHKYLAEDGSKKILNHQRRHSSLGTPDQGTLMEGGYDVENFYLEKGWAADIAKNAWFLNGTLFVIVLNSLYIGFDSEANDNDQLYDADWRFILCENLFCLFFSFELAVRFSAFRQKWDCFRDGWFRFDSLMLFMLIWETWIMGPIASLSQSANIQIPVEPLRLFRMLRLTRLARLIRNIPELVTMTQGLVQGVRASAASLVMILILNYIFAISLHTYLKHEDEFNEMIRTRFGVQFRSLGDCMWILLIDGTFMLDHTGNILTELLFFGKFATTVASFLMLTFLFASAMLICNMVVGVLCEVVHQVTSNERDKKAVRLLRETMMAHLMKFDDGDGMISQEELEQVMHSPESKRLLKELDVDRVFLVALQEMFYSKHGTQLPINGVMEMLLACRGSTAATVHTVANGLSYLSGRLDSVDNLLRYTLSHLEEGVNFDEGPEMRYDIGSAYI